MPSSRIASQTRLCPLGVGLYQVYTGYQPRFVLHTETLYIYCGQAGDDSMCDGAGNCGGGQAVRRGVRVIFTCGLLMVCVVLCGAVWCGVVLCGVVWCCVVLCGVVCCVVCGVAWWCVMCCMWYRGSGTCVNGVYLAKCKPGFPPPLGLPSGIRHAHTEVQVVSSLADGH